MFFMSVSRMWCDCLPVATQRRNVMLADEMGLGKTVQTVALLEHLRSRENIRGPFLIVAPLSTLEHWKREFEDWTKCVVLCLLARASREAVMALLFGVFYVDFRQLSVVCWVFFIRLI